VFAYAKGKSLYVHASAMFDTSRSGAGGGGGLYMPDLNRFGTTGIIFTNGVLRVWDLVPVGTTSVTGGDGSADVRLMIDGDHLRLVGSPAAALVGLYDATGRTYALRCMGSPCQTANVAALASGSYLARIDTGVQVVTVTFTIVL